MELWSAYCPDKAQLTIDGVTYYIYRGIEKLQKEVENFTIRPDDVWISGSAKAGTTWMREIAWCISNNLNFDEASRKSILDRTINFEWQLVENGADHLDNLPSPRIIRTHLPYALLPREIFTKKPTVIYVLRSTKDVLVSYYHMVKNLYKEESLTLDTMVDRFIEGKPPLNPYFKMVFDYWNARKIHSNFLMVRYEELLEEPLEILAKIGVHLGKNYDENQICRLREFVGFAAMKQRASKKLELKGLKPSNFYCSGQVGSYKRSMSPEMIAKLDSYINSKVQGTELAFLAG